MAESQKGTSSADPKDKKSLFDDEMGNEFLSSWKAISVTKDDTMDFSFGEVSGGKKKAFSFEKLDMDFNLDGDFDKLSSFKLDMPDLDFTCPSSKAAKPNERSGGESSTGNRRGKQDCFNFSFDFNELDNFKFDSTLMKGEKTSTKKLDSKGVASCGGESQRSKLNLVGGSNVFDDGQTEKHPASESPRTSMVETVVDVAESGNSLNDDFSSRSGTSVDLVVSGGARTSLEKAISAGAEETDQQSNLLEKAMPAEPCAQQTTEILPVQSLGGNDSTQDTISDVQIDVGYLGTKVNLESGTEHSVNDRMIAGVESNHENSEPTNSSSLYITGSESNGNKNEKTISKIPTENMTETEPLLKDLDLEATCAASLSQTTAHDCKANKDVQNSTSKLLVPLRSELVVDKVAPIQEKESGVVCSRVFQRSEETEPQLSQPLSTGVEVSSTGRGIATMQSSHLENGNSELVVDKMAPIKEKESGDVCSKYFQISKEIEPQLSQPLSTGVDVLSIGRGIATMKSSHLENGKSELVVDTVAPIKEKESGDVRSKYFQISEENEPQLCQPLSTGVEVSSFRRGIATIQSSHPENGKREGFNAVDAQIGRRLVGDSKSLLRELKKPQHAFIGSEKNVKNMCNIKEGFNGDGIQNCRKLVVNPRPPDKEVTERDPVVLGSKTKTKDLNNFCFEGNPASSTGKVAKSSVNSTVVVSSMGSNQSSKIISVEGLKAGKRTPAISSLKISKSVGSSKDQSNATCQREINSLKSSEKNTEAQGNTASKIVHTVASAERKMPVITSLKRKTFEASNADPVPLNPPKRLSQSPTESRILKDHLKNIVEEQVCDRDNHAENKTKNFYDHPTSGPETSPMVNMKELEIPLAMENDENVEKAEAYAKQLEDICNMLKKKHDEAKEILVRAIVNNNSLLMLNHPIFDEKIRAVEKFAARLISH